MFRCSDTRTTDRMESEDGENWENNRRAESKVRGRSEKEGERNDEDGINRSQCNGSDW